MPPIGVSFSSTLRVSGAVAAGTAIVASSCAVTGKPSPMCKEQALELAWMFVIPIIGDVGIEIVDHYVFDVQRPTPEDGDLAISAFVYLVRDMLPPGVGGSLVCPSS